jgi:hypothetical protein
VVLGRAFPVPTAQYIALVRIVPGALLLVREDLIGGLDLGEEGRRAIGVAMVAVGVQFERLPAIGLFESAKLDGCLLLGALPYSSCVAVLSTPSSS